VECVQITEETGIGSVFWGYDIIVRSPNEMLSLPEPSSDKDWKGGTGTKGMACRPNADEKNNSRIIFLLYWNYLNS